MSTITQLSLVRKPAEERPADVASLRADVLAQSNSLIEVVDEWAHRVEAASFRDFEKVLREQVFALARCLITLLFALREARRRPTAVEREGRRFRPAPAQTRSLATLFGVVRYQRVYMREVGAATRRGFHPLDEELGLTSDRFSWNVLALATRLATKLSFAEAKSTLGEFVPSAPSTEVIEQAVLGLGRYTADFIEQTPAPQDDGEVLVIMIDSKGAPTATDSELARRRGKRRKQRLPASPRHRGRALRQRHPKKPRRKKGDKSKNAKMATMVVMYTLRRHGGKLLGPINRRLYASFAPKKHAFAVAQREAAKRGFGTSSRKLVQLVTDGDEDLATYAAVYFPHARHTIDVMHVIEKLWTAGECIHREGSAELRTWVERQKDRLYRGYLASLLGELREHLEAIPRTGPGNKGRRVRLAGVIRYLDKRVDKMRYHEVIAADLELGSGSVEGAIKNIIGKRFDHGGMRWIKERAEALLQLRCIEANGQWDDFIDYAHDRLRATAIATGERIRLQSSTPDALPAVQQAA